MVAKLITELDAQIALSTDYTPLGRGSTTYKAQLSGLPISNATQTALNSKADIHTSTQEIPSGPIDGSNTGFTLAHAPISGTQNLYLNGIFQTEVSDYTLSGTTITFATAPQTGDELTITYQY